jgi:pimeloyl-ACP methyl ester carboxylesterase
MNLRSPSLVGDQTMTGYNVTARTLWWLTRPSRLGKPIKILHLLFIPQTGKISRCDRLKITLSNNIEHMSQVCLNTQKLGQGNPILLLHGWGQTLESLQPLGELIASKACVHLIDLPGFGKSAMPDGDWDTVQYAERILAYMDEQGLERVDLLGHSFGGRVAIRLASKYANRIKNLILINSGGLQRQRSRSLQLRSYYIKTLRSLFSVVPVYSDKLKAWHTEKYGSRDYKNAGALRGTLVKSVIEDLTEEAKKVKAPTLLIWGEADEETPIEMGRRYNQLIENSKLISLPGRDHFLFRGEGAHLCAYYVLKLLEQSEQKQLSHV